MVRWLFLLVFSAALLAAAGCDRPAEKVAQPAAPMERKETQVVVPPEVDGKWQAVQIAVLDKEQGKEELFTVGLGQEFQLPEAGLSIKVQNFLPAFIMDGTLLTSVSNEPRNPAVQIIIRQGEEEVYKGWLFSLFPGTHAFQHPRFSFSLVDYIPAKKG
ncbi:MAG: DUF2155 domain-containing protein [Desulfuromonadales bacterium]|nr:DUF2155 domain-containing protein [Desulfuromonadales bacterium]